MKADDKTKSRAPAKAPAPPRDEEAAIHDGATVHWEPEPATPAPAPPRELPQAYSANVPSEVLEALGDSNRLLAHYVVVEEVGRGGMGSVWKAWDTKLERWVALKILATNDEHSIRRFQREAKLAARLRHPNIAGIYDVGEENSRNYIAMDFIDGPLIAKASLPLPAAIAALVKVCRAIDYAHKNGIIHRDIKPGNIIVTKGGEPFVTDFGLAKSLQSGSASMTGRIMGTPAYMAPEQVEGSNRGIDERCDLYSLGATLYMLATGRAPFEATNLADMLHKVRNARPVPPRQLNPAVPPAIDALILKALSKDKTKRHASAAEMADEIERHMNDAAVKAEAPVAKPPAAAKSPAPPPPPAPRRPETAARVKPSDAAPDQPPSGRQPRTPPQDPTYDFGAYTRAARDVGSDHHDFIRIDDDHLAIVVTDVSTKGVPGSIVMTETRALFKSEGRRSRSPLQVLTEVNRVLYEDLKRGISVTALYLVLSLNKGTALISCAGHKPAFLWRAATNACFLIKPKGLALGIDSGPLFELTLRQEKLQLQPGDRFLIHTDGATDVVNPKQQPLGANRFFLRVKQQAARSSAELLAQLVDQIDKHREGEPLRDDITIVTGRYTPPQAPKR